MSVGTRLGAGMFLTVQLFLLRYYDQFSAFFVYAHDQIAIQHNANMPQGVWDYIATMWHLTVNLT